MIDLTNASFHYSLATMNLKKEYLFYDGNNSLYRHLPRETHSISCLKKLSVREIIGELHRFCQCDDPQQFNLLLTEPFLKKINKMTKKVQRHFDSLSPIFVIINRIFNFFIYEELATTAERLIKARQNVEKHTYYLLGRKLGLTVFTEGL